MAITTKKTANTYVLYTADGAVTDFSFTPPYIKEADVEVFVAQTLKTKTTDYTFYDSDTIRFTSSPATSAEVEFKRKTDVSAPVVTYSESSVITASDLNSSVNQLLYAIQEIKDELARCIKVAPEILASDDTSMTIVGGGAATTVQNVKRVDSPSPGKIVQDKSTVTLKISQDDVTDRTTITLEQGASSESDVILGSSCP